MKRQYQISFQKSGWVFDLLNYVLYTILERMESKRRVLVVGQTPPPYGGQALMIKYMIDSQYDKIEMYHVRMVFSKEFNERGKLSIYKIMHIFIVIYQILKARFKYKIDLMYYPPSSAPKVALLRDTIILGFTRFLFNKVVFHFHAAGVSEELPKYNPFLRSICYSALSKPDLAITSSEYNPKDGEYLKAKKIEIIPLGIPDLNPSLVRERIGERQKLNILFVGLLNSTKGEGYIIEALHLLKQRRIEMNLYIAGRFETENYKHDFFKLVSEYRLEHNVIYYGVVTGEKKQELFLNSDILCFPSFFSSESFGIVLLEGMMYQMPIIATKWRGIRSVVDEGNNGFLVDIRNAHEIAESLEKLDLDRGLLRSMANKSRSIFEDKYEITNYLRNLENAIYNI